MRFGRVFSPGFNRLCKPKGRQAFLLAQMPGFTLLDVGCGNDSPALTKAVRPDCRYLGIDVADYNLSARSKQLADIYRVVPAEGFADAIAEFEGSVDAVVSWHNLEHCNDPKGVLRAMCRALRPGGALYLSFPSKASTGFPSRRGTLNFFDDPTHKQPPDVNDVLALLHAEGVEVTFLARRYRPLVPTVIGLLLEPVSALTRRLMPFGSTWAFYGFEVVIWAHRPRPPHGP